MREHGTRLRGEIGITDKRQVTVVLFPRDPVAQLHRVRLLSGRLRVGIAPGAPCS